MISGGSLYAIVKTFAYNTANNITEERVYVNGGRFYHNTYTFDTQQRIRTVTSNGQLLSTYAYNANGSRSSTTLSNGAATEYTRNLSGFVTRLVNRQGTTVLSQFDYVYYLDGNTHRVTEVMEGVTRTVTYTYDTARRLTREHDTGAGGGAITRAYTFDNRGNRSQMAVTGAETYTVTYTHDLNNRLLTETQTGSNPSTAIFTHDRNGNQLTRVSGGQTETRTYDAFNRLTQFTSSTVTSTYTYRVDGLRHSMTVNGSVTNHVWLRGHIVMERNAVGSVNWLFFRSLRGRLLGCASGTIYLHNARGDVISIIRLGTVLRIYRYSAFGVELYPAVNDFNRFRFGGEYWDAHRGEYYLRARSFSPRLGRFTQPDPFWGIHNMRSSPNAIAQAGNLFVFVMNNPVMFIDPTGLYGIPWAPRPASTATTTSAAAQNALNAARIRELLNRTPTPPRPTHPAVTVIQSGNDVTINAVVRIGGKGADMYISPGVTFRQAAIQGIIDNWGGHRGGLNVTVNITDIGRGIHLLRRGQGWLDINIGAGAGYNHLQLQIGGWSTRTTGYIVLSHGDNQTSDDHRFGLDLFGRVAAHEFGHALGIDDAGAEFDHYMSIMTSSVWWCASGASRLDLALVLEAQDTSQWQTWYNNRYLIKRYGVSR